MTQPSAPTGQNRLLLVAAFAIVLLAGIGAWFAMSRDVGASVNIGGPFTLVDGNGKTVTDKDFRGHYLLVYFGYTFCPDVCPTTLNEVAAAFDKLGKHGDKLQALFITVDPARDKPSVVRDYAAAFSPHIEGLTGSDAQIAAVAREYRVYYQAQHTADSGNSYSVDHSSILYLMGPDGRFIEAIRTDQTGEAMAAEIEKRLG